MEASPSSFLGSSQSGVAMHEDSISDVMASGPSEEEPGGSTPSTPKTPVNVNSPDKTVKTGSGGKKKKRKTPTDVNAPKKPVSAYISYLNERRETVKSENPTMSYPDILKKLAAEWSSMSPEARKKYHEEANK